jgi:hypothetical protein
LNRIFASQIPYAYRSRPRQEKNLGKIKELARTIQLAEVSCNAEKKILVIPLGFH